MRQFFATIRKKIDRLGWGGGRLVDGFTIAEVLIASSVFVVVSLIGVTIFIDIMRIQRRIILENAIYEDARFMMERIAREVRYNTVDYEEYYRDALGVLHGENFGCYAERFYNPGDPDAIGAECSDPPGGDPLLNPGCVINKNSLDTNTGQNPYAGNGTAETFDANAFCDEVEIGAPYNDCSLGSLDFSLQRDELYLINPAGARKTYMGRKEVNGTTNEHGVGILKLNGRDDDNDGIFEVWHDSATDYDEFCAEGYSCPSGTVTDLTDNLSGADSADLYEGFVPVTPLRTDVTDLQFFISPAEDPRKAFAETAPDEGIQQQPHVTVIMTVQPAESELQGFAGDVPTVTLQSTITSRTYNEVKSYLGYPVCP